jgi:methyl-accepting chemotaxis protein
MVKAVGVEMADREDPNSRIVVGSIPTVTDRVPTDTEPLTLDDLEVEKVGDNYRVRKSSRSQRRVLVSDRMDGILAAAAVIEALFLTWMGLRLSHRVAGPLLRLKNEMLRTAQGGEVTPLKFRDGDYFEDLAEAYNQQAKKR